MIHTTQFRFRSDGEPNQYKSTLILIAVVTFIFAIVKLPLEVKILSSIFHPIQSVDDFYSSSSHQEPRKRRKPYKKQNIDIRSYQNLFNRGAESTIGHPRSLLQSDYLDSGDHAEWEEDDKEMARKVKEIMKRYSYHHEHEDSMDTAGSSSDRDNRGDKRGHLRPGADHDMFYQRVWQVVQRHFHHSKNNNNNEQKQGDPFDKEFEAEIEAIVDGYAS